MGYSIRFEDCTSPETVIKYMTDGMLLRECLADTTSRVLADHARRGARAHDPHRRALRPAQGAARQAEGSQAHLHLGDARRREVLERTSSECPIFTIPGRTFPVEILYTKAPESDYLDAALITVMQIHLSEPPGDILLFLTGQEEIDTRARSCTSG